MNNPFILHDSSPPPTVSLANAKFSAAEERFWNQVEASYQSKKRFVAALPLYI